MDKNTEYSVRIISGSDKFHPHFFIRKDFLEYQASISGACVVNIGVFSEENNKLLAYCTLSGKGGHWQSPITGAFGGVSNIKNIRADALELLVENIPRLLSSEGPLLSIAVKLPPSCFQDYSAVFANILHRHHWNLTGFDLNYHLKISSVDDFLNGLGQTKRKFIRRLNSSGAEFLEVGKEKIETVYSVINKNRAAQGYPMTMPLASIVDLVERFEDDLRLFAVTLEGQVIASAICIQATPKYLYVFYWGELPDFREKSPVLLLVKKIVEFCSDRGIEIMDIGTSSVNSVPNMGLCEFKDSLGCLVTQKLKYEWTE